MSIKNYVTELDAGVTKEELNTIVAGYTGSADYKKPIMFAIVRNDMGVFDPALTLQSDILTLNVNENEIDGVVLAIATATSDVVFESDSEKIVDLSEEAVDKLMNVYSEEITVTEDKTKLPANILNAFILSNVKTSFATAQMQQQGIVYGKGNYTYRAVFIYEDAPVETVESAYLKLQSLSEGKSELRSLNLNGIFGVLENLAWTTSGDPIELEMLRQRGAELKAVGQYPTIDYVDKFPRLLRHVVPDQNTRILDTAKVRFGAQLAAGTTVMPGAAYINFNAGTIGESMVEGRISSSAKVGAGSDVGGGASILGVLSGTDGVPVTIGEKCLLGANSVTGISLGDNCVIDAGVTVLAGTKINMSLSDRQQIAAINGMSLDDLVGESAPDSEGSVVVKGSFLSGLNGLHFRMDTANGTVMKVYRNKKAVTLNEDLH